MKKRISNRTHLSGRNDDGTGGQGDSVGRVILSSWTCEGQMLYIQGRTYHTNAMWTKETFNGSFTPREFNTVNLSVSQWYKEHHPHNSQVKGDIPPRFGHMNRDATPYNEQTLLRCATQHGAVILPSSQVRNQVPRIKSNTKKHHNRNHMQQNPKGPKITKETYRQVLKEGFNRAPPSKDSSVAMLFEEGNMLPGLEVKEFGLIGLPLHPLLTTALKSTATKVNDHVYQWKAGSERNEITKAFGRAMLREDVELTLHGLTLEEVSESAHTWPKNDLHDKDFFGYLIVTLPTHHEGGAIKISTNREGRTYKTSPLSHHRYQILSFFRQCKYTSSPLTTGQRIQLIFKISALEGKSPPVLFTGKEEYVRRMVKAMRVWKKDPDRTEALCYACDRYHTGSQDPKERTRRRIAEILREELRLGFYHGSVSPEPVITFDGLGNACYQDQLLVQFGTSSDYLQSLMSRVNHTIKKEGKNDMGILQSVPNDIVEYILSSYTSARDMVQLDQVSSGMSARVNHSVRTIMNRFVQEAIRMGRHDILTDWRGLVNHHEQLKKDTPHEAIIRIMPDLVTADNFLMTDLVTLSTIVGRLMDQVRRSYVSQGIKLDSNTPYCAFIDSWITAVLNDKLSQAIPLLKHLFFAERYADMERIVEANYLHFDNSVDHYQKMSPLMTYMLDFQTGEEKRDLNRIKIFVDLARDLMDSIVELMKVPKPVHDWTMPVREAQARHCTRCIEVGRFLRHPNEKTLVVRYPKPQRLHVVLHLVVDLGLRVGVSEERGKTTLYKIMNARIETESIEWVEKKRKAKKMFAALKAITKCETKNLPEEEEGEEEDQEEKEGEEQEGEEQEGEEEEEEEREEKPKKRAMRGRKGPARKKQRRK
ncbi:hypothetical protein PROFUN_13653 [Planoprotostelium fungivorum]|uniref:Uncharacterized protein n=1 Tax=Planoprotostelium fungivorum TaxID=1890364 RepID=A0A2P6N3E3_9EUKA|nr:hypothetical protein PROFUN_13653 [Planoprotostelium fungivorum]